jgi:hypothetical protein
MATIRDKLGLIKYTKCVSKSSRPVVKCSSTVDLRNYLSQRQCTSGGLSNWTGLGPDGARAAEKSSAEN